jgi:Ala-tRNA(Pro) deacylase
MAYGVKTIWDPKSSLGKLDEVFFEAGDHQTLVQMSGVQFHELMAPAERGVFSHHI